MGFSGGPIRADVPVPVRLTQPANAAEAWNVIRLALANTDRLFDESRVEEVKDQISLLAPALRVLASEGALAGQQGDAEAIATGTFDRINLLVRESMAGNLEGARSVFGRLQTEVKRLEEVFPPGMSATEVYSCVDHPEVADFDSARTCPECGNGLRARRFPYSVIFTRNETPSLSLELKTTGPLRAHEANSIALRLTGSAADPAGPDDLVVSHSRRLHLILVDETGSDFQHLAPEPGNEPGTYAAPFRPVSSASYRAWVLAVPASTRLTETLAAKLPGSDPPQIVAAPPEGSGIEGLVSEREGLVVRLMAPGSGPLRIQGGKTNLVQVHVSRSDGSPVRQVEPLWNAFVHLSLVSWDFDSVFQVHSVGGEILSSSLRGGPDFAFKLHPPEPGWWRLYLQLRFEERTLTFPLHFQAAE